MHVPICMKFLRDNVFLSTITPSNNDSIRSKCNMKITEITT